MGSIYVLIAGLLLYFIAVRMVSLSRMGAITASCLVVIGYFVINSFIDAINYSVYDVPISHLFGLSQMMTVVVQFILACIVFAKIQAEDDSYATLIVFGTMGCLGIFFVIPTVAGFVK